MPISVDNLPFDILFYITADLDLDDIVHLSQTCRQLRANLSEGTLCRRTVEVYSNRKHINADELTPTHRNMPLIAQRQS